MKRITRLLIALLLSIAICFSMTSCDVIYDLINDYLAMEHQDGPASAVDLDSIPEFRGYPYVVINDNVPFFTETQIKRQSFEFYSDLDSLGRCGYAMASIGIDLMPTSDREEIGTVKPAGWVQHKYDCVDGSYLYNRCHLIGFQLTGENANEKNLITGTRFMNVEGMLPFENMVDDYIEETKNHVMYRVTPIYTGNYLVANGVLMEAYSVEDNGELSFCVYVYNCQPGVRIDYKTGTSKLDDGVPFPSEDIKLPDGSEPNLDDDSVSKVEETLVINLGREKYHLPTCTYANTEKYNCEFYTGTRAELEDQGFTACGHCKP